MKKFLNENWFKIGILVLGFSALAVFFYVEAKKQNLAVFNKVGGCISLNCLEAVREHSIHFSKRD
ncbi:MAG: hypothetical protein COV91_01490 [Candidatus Taylorbacteria bacterium CG11_big_fil_rev_8_21_14_0_20_46_11]|uniref:Uncharacterized protein n=1 Tax=Candidatus Taylorbacteria bacterium CG11_big_fil_rev_8_21_14_0_20_46_11 TaxID=1975025 RepID=A0A2H0KEV2_9BACT|nr:MAG: hypothetical protein COV91_01490 [Candidatus Taylorbacteria bacterium CG11_big_fil_rev_8_21_14_0_20_46_11]